MASLPELEQAKKRRRTNGDGTQSSTVASNSGSDDAANGLERMLETVRKNNDPKFDYSAIEIVALKKFKCNSCNKMYTNGSASMGPIHRHLTKSCVKRKNDRKRDWSLFFHSPLSNRTINTRKLGQKQHQQRFDDAVDTTTL